jgi:GLPGLI family protein
MKKRLFIAIGLSLYMLSANAQQKAGKVTYQQNVKKAMGTMGLSTGASGSTIPPLGNATLSTQKYTLYFGNNQSLWQQVEEVKQGIDLPSGVSAMNATAIPMGNIGVGMSSPDDIIFYDFGRQRETKQCDFMGKKFLVEDTISRMNWKLGNETKTLLGHICQKASTQKIEDQMRMQVTDVRMEQVQIKDTINAVAWFTTDIPVQAGPNEYQGQLPGLILELDMNNGEVVYKALEINVKVDTTGIKAPTKGKKLTSDEFAKEKDKVIKRMQQTRRSTLIRVN